MKPEELDRLFRDELEKLDHVPGINWNDEGAWNKLNTHLKGGWNNLWTWTLSTVAVIGVSYLLYTVYTPKVSTIQKKDIPAKKAVAVQVDAISTDSSVKNKPVISNPYKAKVRKVTAKHMDTISLNTTDTIAALLEEQEISEVKPEVPFKRNTLLKLPVVKPEFAFQMPHMSLFRLKVNNSFNVSNLVKSIQAEQKADQNFYYFYEYDKNFVPPAFGNTHQRFTIGNNPVITNFNR